MSANLPLAGETAIAPSFTEDVQTSASSNVSAETVAQTVTASLENGKDYEIEWDGLVNGSANGNECAVKLRVGSTTSGTVIGDGGSILMTAAARVYPGHVYGRFTAAATGNQAFSVTVALAAGSGTVRRYGAAAAPNYLRVRRIG